MTLAFFYFFQVFKIFGKTDIGLQLDISKQYHKLNIGMTFACFI